MRIIKQLSEMIDEELNDARKYAKCANMKKMENKALADVFYRLANEEMGHAMALHAEVVKIIDKYRKESGDPPALMQEFYNYVHEQMIEKSTEVKSILAMYQS